MLPDGSVGPDPCLRPPQGRGPRRQSPGYFRLLVPKDGTMGSARLPDTGGHFSRLLSQTSYYYWLSWVEGAARPPVVSGILLQWGPPASPILAGTSPGSCLKPHTITG